MVLAMENSYVPSLPKTVTTPPAEPTLYTVYIAVKQWEKVEPTLQNPEDTQSVIVDGVCAYDEAVQGIAVFATNVTTKLTKRAMGRGPTAPGRKPARPGSFPARPVPKPTPPSTPPLPTKYKPGQQVRHPQFGVGVVLESKVIHGDEEVVVEFEVSGRRRLPPWRHPPSLPASRAARGRDGATGIPTPLRFGGHVALARHDAARLSASTTKLEVAE